VVALLSAFLASCSGDSPSPPRDRSRGWLAVVQDDEVRLIDPDDARMGPLSPRGGAGPIQWSPDARSIAFESEGEIMTGLAEGRPRTVTSYGGTGSTAHEATWSPDSTRVAFTVRGATPGLAVLDARTGAVTDVYEGDVDLGGWWNVPGVAFEHLVIADIPTGRVYAIDRFGAMPRYLATGTQPVTSPIDQRVAFVDGDALRVWVSPDEVVTLAEEYRGVGDVDWSDDGTLVAFSDSRGVWAVPSNGGVPTQVSDGGRFPTWNQDGTEIAIERDGEILVVPAGGGEARLVSSGSSPAWQPARRFAEVVALDVVLPRGEPPTNDISLDVPPLTSVPAVSLEPAFPNLLLNGALTDAVYLGGAIDRFYGLIQDGVIVTFPNDSTVTSATPFLIPPADIHSAREGGLLSLAFDPNVLLNGYLYIYYTTGTFTDGTSEGQPPAPRRNVLSRFSVMPGRLDLADPASELILLEILPTTNETNQHNAGQIAFGPDGYLYLSIGDTNEPGTSQDLARLEGSILRIDVSKASAQEPYVVPSDNPFVDVPGARPEIWAYGLRNPWRFSIDPVTGEIWSGDVGSNGAISAEEINIVVPGGNYGWPAQEGNRVADCILYDCAAMTSPIWSYPRAVNPQVPCVAVVGGYVYRGAALEGLGGAYLFTDLCLGTFSAIRRHADGTVEVAEIGRSPLGPGGLDPGAQISSLIPGPDGEPYAVLIGSARIWKMVPASQVAQPGGY